MSIRVFGAVHLNPTPNQAANGMGHLQHLFDIPLGDVGLAIVEESMALLLKASKPPHKHGICVHSEGQGVDESKMGRLTCSSVAADTQRRLSRLQC